MKAVRVHHFGGPEAIVVEDIPRPVPSEGELLVRVSAAGVGPWDALIREGKSKVSPPPPLTLGSDFSGVVEEIGTGVSSFVTSGFKKGDEVYGVTNPQFCGAQAEYAVAAAGMIARKPQHLSHVEAASVPVVAVTAWQMLFEYGQAKAGQSVMILGAGGNVGAYATQLAAKAGLRVIAVVGSKDTEYARDLGSEIVVDYQTTGMKDHDGSVDLVLDTVGGELREQSFKALRPNGVLVSVASPLPPQHAARGVFFYVEVTTGRLTMIARLFDRRELMTNVGSILPLEQASVAHAMLAGAPHKRGKILLLPAP
ncbi:MAG TPA: NADP-dependent oxidoreductase [Candidatus Angelobacter sp.]|nr:NADP-dependent oxidoreductase [Candidatus Angelobacter sp.]